jgi:hypothetical protein
MRRRVRGHFASQPVGQRWAYLALLRGTTWGNDRLGTRVQGLSFGVRRLVAAKLRTGDESPAAKSGSELPHSENGAADQSTRV